MRRLVVSALLAGVLAGCAASPEPEATSLGAAALLFDDDAVDDEGHGALATTLLYIPNRILDLLDIVRARVRVGPGVALGLRATELADVFVGSYITVFAGLPGPRNRVLPKLPFGLETKTGAEASLVDATVEGPVGPDYGPAEIGLSFQLLIIGVDVGLEPGELLDFLAGLLTFDPRDDDF